MERDAFSKRHPVVNLVFFLGAVGFGVVIQHPAYLAAGLICSCVYHLLLYGWKGLRRLLVMVPFFLFLAFINPVFNTYGQTMLFSFFGRPYTLEALLYGFAVAGILVVMLIWFSCCSAVLTSDKFTSLFGNLIPALSLLLVMVLRLIPNLIRKTNQLLGARKSIGKGGSDRDSNREKLEVGTTVLSALTDWALEGSVVTGDSMRSRGYGTARRTSFMIYRLKGLDIALLLLQLGLMAIAAGAALLGGAAAEYTPQLYIAPLTGFAGIGFASYCVFLLIPTILHIKEALQWHISRSGI